VVIINPEDRDRHLAALDADPAQPPPSRIEWPPETEPDITYHHTYKSGARYVEPAVSRETSALAALEELIDVPPLTAPQAQGDVIILPWPPTSNPYFRGPSIDAAALIPAEGVAIEPTRSHILLPVDLPADGSGPRPRYAQLDVGHTLGVLVVEEGAAARLSHHEHGDLLIGPGVYALHRQQRWTPRGTAPAAD
jgi:hypothetical protein